MIALEALLKFFLDTRLGQSIVLAVALSLAVWAAYSWAYDKGYAACHAEHAGKVAKANTDQREGEVKRDKAGIDIADQTTAVAAQATQATARSTEATKEVIRYVYRDPPKTAPVVAGSCVHPLDDRVQQRIDRAVEQANAASGGL